MGPSPGAVATRVGSAIHRSDVDPSRVSTRRPGSRPTGSPRPRRGSRPTRPAGLTEATSHWRPRSRRGSEAGSPARGRRRRRRAGRARRRAGDRGRAAAPGPRPPGGPRCPWGGSGGVAPRAERLALAVGVEERPHGVLGVVEVGPRGEPLPVEHLEAQPRLAEVAQPLARLFAGERRGVAGVAGEELVPGRRSPPGCPGRPPPRAPAAGRPGGSARGRATARSPPPAGRGARGRNPPSAISPVAESREGRPSTTASPPWRPAAPRHGVAGRRRPKAAWRRGTWVGRLAVAVWTLPSAAGWEGSGGQGAVEGPEKGERPRRRAQPRPRDVGRSVQPGGVQADAGAEPRGAASPR